MKKPRIWFANGAWHCRVVLLWIYQGHGETPALAHEAFSRVYPH